MMDERDLMPATRSVSLAKPLLGLFLGLAALSLLGASLVNPHPTLALVAVAQAATPTLAPGTGGITGLAWSDLDSDGVRDTDEPPLEGLLVTLQSSQIVSSASSGANGSYYLGALPPDIYRLKALPPSGYQLTTPGDFDVLVSVHAVLILDFGAIFVPTPTPSPTEEPTLDITGATQAFCGGVYQSDTRAGRSNISRYGCRPAWDESGPEMVYRIELERSQTLTVSLLSTAADLDLFLLRYVYPDSCVAAGDNVLSHESERGVYFLTVDGYKGVSGNFTLRVNCPHGLQATPTLTYTPSPTLPATLTYTPGPTPTPTATQALHPSYLPLLLQSSNATGMPQPVTSFVWQGADRLQRAKLADYGEIFILKPWFF